MKLHRAWGRKAYCRDTLPCPKLHQRLAHKRSIPSAQRHWHLTPKLKPAGCFFDKWKFPVRYLPSQGGLVGEKERVCVCVNLMHAHARLIPVRFAWEQLSRWKYLILFLISHTTITVIKLSFCSFFFCWAFLTDVQSLKGTLNISNCARCGYLKVHVKASTDTHIHTRTGSWSQNEWWRLALNHCQSHKEGGCGLCLLVAIATNGRDSA